MEERGRMSHVNFHLLETCIIVCILYVDLAFFIAFFFPALLSRILKIRINVYYES